MNREKCLICGGKVTERLNLGMHPLADRFVKRNDPSPDKLWPLVLDGCTVCGQVQSRTIVSDQEKYQDTEYSYTASHGRKHWAEFAIEMTERFAPGEALEIGSNDGTLLLELQKRGWKALGIDASPVSVSLAKGYGCEAQVGIFDQETRLGKFNLIIANNVLNHTGNPLGFMKGVAANLKPNGVFVAEVPDFRAMVARDEFDQIYLEHTSYFNLCSLNNLFRTSGLQISSVQKVDYHGGSLRVYADSLRYTKVLAEPSINWASYNQKIKEDRKAFLLNFWSENTPVVAIGAAAKGNTFLNYYGLDNTSIEFVTDSSPLKIGKMTPGTRIPIETDDILRSYNEVRVLPLAWNIPGLTAKIKEINPNARVLER